MTIGNVENILLQWRSDGVELNDPAEKETIEAAEKVIGFVFPQDFKNFYLKADGFKDWDCEANMFSIWPIERIVTEYQQSKTKSFVGFCDYLINCHQIGFFKGRAGIYKSYDEFNSIARSFEEVLRLINSDSNLIQ